MASLRPDAGPDPRPDPWSLPRLVMRRAALGALLLLALTLAFSWRAMHNDIDAEVQAGLHLAALAAALNEAPRQDDATALARLAALQREGGLRHLALELRDPSGRLLFAPASPERDAGLARWLARWLDTPDDRSVQWWLPRPDGRAWQVRLTASHDSERREALSNLTGVLALVLLCVVGLLGTMHWQLKRGFQPLGRLLHAIGQLGRGQPAELRSLGPMPIVELEAVAQAMRELDARLDEVQAQRRALSQKMLTLQEEERARIAHELHDELGQRLTAMRVGAAHLLRQLPPEAPWRASVVKLRDDCVQLQREVRLLLAGLQPLGGGEPGERGQGPESLDRLASLLRAMVGSWNDSHPQGPGFELQLSASDAQGRPQPWPEGLDAEAWLLPRTVALVLYRISQESLTNAARHAQARHVTLALRLQQAADGSALMHWQASDDGVGLSDLDAAYRRGNGLAGISQRVWALGGSLQVQPQSPGAARPGLRLTTQIALPAAQAAAAASEAAAGA